MVQGNNLQQQVALNMGLWGGSGQGEGGHKAMVDALTGQQKLDYEAAIAQASYTPALQEDLHGWEKSGLETLARGADTTQMNKVYGNLTADSGAALDRSSEYAATGASTITAEEVEALRNPYSTALKDQLSESAEKVRAQAMVGQGQRGGRSFGDTSTGIQMSNINSDIIQGENTIDYNTWQDAMAQATGGRGRNLQAAGLETNNAGTYGANAANTFNMAKDISGTGVANAQAQINAGSYVRDYNQNINDIMLQDIKAKQADELARLQNEQGLLAPYGGQQSTGGSAGGANTMQQIGGAGQALAGVYTNPQGYNSGMPAGAVDLGNAMPWLN